MIVMLEILARLPAMPPMAVLEGMAADPAFGAEPISRLPGHFMVRDAYTTVRYALDRWPADEPQRRTLAAHRIGTLAQLRAIPGMPSLTTITQLIQSHSDFPLIERGNQGTAYRIDLPIAAAFIWSNWSDKRYDSKPRARRS